MKELEKNQPVYKILSIANSGNRDLAPGSSVVGQIFERDNLLYNLSIANKQRWKIVRVYEKYMKIMVRAGLCNYRAGSRAKKRSIYVQLFKKEIII